MVYAACSYDPTPQDSEMVEYRNGPESVELKVPMEDSTATAADSMEPVKA